MRRRWAKVVVGTWFSLSLTLSIVVRERYGIMLGVPGGVSGVGERFLDKDNPLRRWVGRVGRYFPRPASLPRGFSPALDRSAPSIALLYLAAQYYPSPRRIPDPYTHAHHARTYSRSYVRTHPSHIAARLCRAYTHRLHKHAHTHTHTHIRPSRARAYI